MSPQDRTDAVFHALADPTRRELLARLSQQPSSPTMLAAGLPVSRQAVTKHLLALSKAGLVERSRHGRETRYRLNPAPLSEVIAWMGTVGAAWDRRLARLHELLEGDQEP